MTQSNEKCFECDAGVLTPAVVELTGERNGEQFTVTVSGFACTSCGYKTIDNNQSAEFTKAVSDAYKAAHDLLTGAELRECRRVLGMSQQEFADYLGVGAASVKRWESGQIQDRAMDKLIRLKTDPEAARSNLRTLEDQVPEECVLSSVKLGDRDVELRFSRDLSFTGQPRMKMGRFPMDQPYQFDPDEVIAA
jgi:putative zinc finger/helix-turn-helix YgiT family protein